MDTLSVPQAAELLHIHPRRVRALARAGALPAARIGRKWLFRREELDRLLGRSQPAAPQTLEGLSARNHLRGRITRLSLDGLMAEVRLDVGGQELVSIITRASAERLGLAEGAEVFAVIKATEVMVGRE